ncbi:5738_t:CDS:2, partial [Ambispora leptoticha]
NYTFGTKEAQPEEDPSVAARLARLQNDYETSGMRRTVEGVLVFLTESLLVHINLIFFAFASSNVRYDDDRPGDYLRPGEDEIEGLKNRLSERLAPVTNNYNAVTNSAGGSEQNWEIGECLSVWWRPNFETFM